MTTFVPPGSSVTRRAIAIESRHRRRLLAAATGGGALLGAVAGHAAAGMSRSDLKELGEHLDAGQAGLLVVAVSDMQAKVEAALKHAVKLETRQLKADAKQLEADARDATFDRPVRAGDRVERLNYDLFCAVPDDC